MAFFHTLLAAFLFVSANTAPPAKIVSETDVLKTCIYIHAQGLPMPTQCSTVVDKLNLCANTPKPPYPCFTMIGYKGEIE
jgi:hypothetical protein